MQTLGDLVESQVKRDLGIKDDHPIHLGGLIEAPARVGQPSQGFRRLSSVGSRIEERGHGDLLVLCDGEVRSANRRSSVPTEILDP